MPRRRGRPACAPTPVVAEPPSGSGVHACFFQSILDYDIISYHGPAVVVTGGGAAGRRMQSCAAACRAATASATMAADRTVAVADRRDKCSHPGPKASRQ